MDGATICASAEEVARGASVVLCCTSAAATVVDADWLVPGQLVTSVSTNAPLAREVDPAQLDRYSVTCDFRATTPLAAAELACSPVEIVADLPELIAGTVTVGRDRPIFFRSMGLGIEDLAIAALLLDGQPT